MKAFWTRPCSHCGQPILKDSEMHYVSYNKKAYHPACANVGPQGPPEPDALSVQHALATALGFSAKPED